eukprot:m.174870 g.174870  ORF g.174870 m.174870 type:complete len:155 (-) comp17337_c0_seq1:65-529(-)
MTLMPGELAPTTSVVLMIGASTSKDCTKTTSLLCVDAASTDDKVTALYEVAVYDVAVYVAVVVVVEVEEVELNDSSVALGAPDMVSLAGGQFLAAVHERQGWMSGQRLHMHTAVALLVSVIKSCIAHRIITINHMPPTPPRVCSAFRPTSSLEA